MASRRAEAMRRYSAFGYFAGASALALLLPSGLTVPNAGPPTIAEYAPVPGQGPSDQQGDLGRLGAPGSSGIGSGGVGEGGARPGDTPDTIYVDDPSSGGGESQPGNKRCVGTPPRQTEDPLSPPCIGFFEGDNGGATARGVTATEVKVVLDVDYNESTDRRGKRTVDCAEPVNPDEDTVDDMLCKSYMAYFNERYQTYGRRVHLYANHGVPPGDVIERYQPFAGVSLGGSIEWTKRDVLSVGYMSNARELYKRYAPLMIGFRPDFEDSAAMAASYICLKLDGRPASFTDDPLIEGQPRKFAYWSDNPLKPYDRAVLDALKRTCGLEIEHFAAGVGDTTAAARLRSAGVTTVVILVGNTSHAVVTRQATAAGWYPEWVIPGAPAIREINTNFYGRLADQSQWANTIGITFDYRRDTLGDQHWFRAYREGCPDCAAPTVTGGSGAPQIYDELTLLFYGIQASGPRLTAENVDRGLHAIPPNGSPNPYKPAAYFAPGNYTFVKDAMAIWWDPAGVPPGTGNRGCYRLPREGKRYRANEWARGDDDVQMPGPCQGDTFNGG